MRLSSPYRIAFLLLFMPLFTNAPGAGDDAVATVLLICPRLRPVQAKAMVNQAERLPYLHQSLENAVAIVG